MNFEILYCFDKNYNIQAYSSMISLLDNVNEKLKINIIHSDNIDISELPNKIVNHKNLDEIKIFNFNNKINNFPNIENSHISEATYYRFFIADYIHQDTEFLFYIDCDVICISNPLSLIKKNLKNLKNSKYVISAKTDLNKNLGSDILFDDLLMSSEYYFNAGVMIIDYQKWLSQNIEEKLIDKLNLLFTKVRFWDQDILNATFDGSFQDLDKSLNHTFEINNKKNNEKDIEEQLNKKEIKFIHYHGSNKPWTIEGVLQNSSTLYQENFRKLGFGKYHITHRWKKHSFNYLVKEIFNLRIPKFDLLIQIIKSFIVF